MSGPCSEVTRAQVFRDGLTMSEAELVLHANRPAASAPRASLWVTQLPYVAVFALTILGVAYTSVAHQPLVGYWEFLSVAIAAVCISAGWPNAQSKAARLRLIWTQVLHWTAILVAMNMVLARDAQLLLNAPTTGLALLLLLALGTFIAGVHAASWRICVLGIAMALCVPAIARLTNSALYLFLGAMALVGIGTTIWWRQAPETASNVPGAITRGE